MAEIDKLNFVMGMNTSGMAKGGNIVTRVFGKMDTRFKAVLGTVGVMSAIFIGFAVKAVKAASEFEVAWNEVRTLIDETKIDSEALREEVLDLAAAVGRPPEEVSRGLYQVISAGVTDAADAMFVLEVATEASIAGLTDQFTAVDAITTVMNAWGLEIKDTTRIADLMFNAVKEGKLTFSDLANNIGQVASTAALASVSFEEVTAALATMTKAGLSMEESTTALNQLLLQTIKAQDDAKVTAKEFGFELSSTALKAKGLVGLMNDIAEATEGDIDALVALMPNIRAFRGEAILAGTGVDEFNRILKTTETVLGASKEAFNKIKQSTTELAREMETRINIVFIRLGQKLLPLVNQGLKQVIEFLDSIGESRIEKLVKLLSDLEGGENLAAQIILREKQRELVAELTEMQLEMVEIEKEGSNALLESVELVKLWGSLTFVLRDRFREISTSIIKIAKGEKGLLELEKLRGDAQKLFDLAIIDAGKEMLENNNKLSKITEDGLKLSEGTVVLIDAMINKLKLQALTQEDIIELEEAIGELRAKGVEDTEDINENLKEAASTELKLDLNIAFANIGKAGNAIRDLSGELFKVGSAADSAVIGVVDIVSGIAELQDVTSRTESALIDKLIPGLGLATVGISLLSKFMDRGAASAEKAAEASRKLAEQQEALARAFEKAFELQNITKRQELTDRLRNFIQNTFGDIFSDALFPGLLDNTELINLINSNIRQVSAIGIKAFPTLFGAIISALGDIGFDVESEETRKIASFFKDFIEDLGGGEAFNAFVDLQLLIKNALKDGKITDEEATAIDEAIARIGQYPELLAAMNDGFLDSITAIANLTEQLKQMAAAAKKAAEDLAKTEAERALEEFRELVAQMDRGQIFKALRETGLSIDEILALFAQGEVEARKQIAQILAEAVFGVSDFNVRQIILLQALLEALFGIKETLDETEDAIKKQFDRRRVDTGVGAQRHFIFERKLKIAEEDGGGILDPFLPENRSVRQFVGITELQGNLVIGILNTSRAIQQSILEVLLERLEAGFGGVDIGTINASLGEGIENAERSVGVL